MSTSIGEIRLKRGTAAQWSASNPTLLSGETGFESDTVKLKIGDGVTPWNLLPYVTGSGGAGGINYVSNSSADTGTLGWTVYADAAAALPTDGLDGTPTISWLRSTTTPLRGRGDFNLVKPIDSCQGQGVSYAFQIDRSDLAKVLTVSFEYELISGTYATGDLTVYIAYEEEGVTKIIQPSGYSVMAAATGVPVKEIAQFQTHSSIRNYRLILHIASASAFDYTLALTNITVGPQVVQYGAPVTDFENKGAITIGSTGTAPTKGAAPQVDRMMARRVGDSAEILYEYSQTTAGTSGTGFYLFSLPPGMSFDLAKVNTSGGLVRNPRDPISVSAVGEGILTSNDSLGFNSFARLYAFSATQFYVHIVSSQSTSGGGDGSVDEYFGSISYALGGSPLVFRFKLCAPIQGWSSTVQMSNDTDTRVVAAAVTGLSATVGTGAVLPFSTSRFDTHGGLSGLGTSSFRYTAQIPGIYLISVELSNVSTANVVLVYKNGALLYGTNSDATIVGYNSVSSSSGTRLIQLNAGDYVDIRNNTSGSSVTFSFGTFEIQRISGPSAIASSETVAFSAFQDSGQQIPSSETVVIYNQVTDDSHGSYNKTTGVWTSPISGRFLILANAAFFTAVSDTHTWLITIRRNGSAVATHVVNKQTTSFGARVTVSAGTELRLISGDQITIGVFHDTGSLRGLVGGVATNVSIVRIGN